MKKILFSTLMIVLSMNLIGCKNDDLSSSNSNSTNNSLNSSSSKREELPTEDDKIHLIVLAGQSGARGKALVNDLNSKLKVTNYDVDIIADGLVMEALDNIPLSIDESINITPLKPGFGDYPSEFGPELGIGQTLASRYPKYDEKYKSVVVKYTACGSTFLDHWYSESSYLDDEISSYLNIEQVRENKNGDMCGPLTNNLYQLIDHTIELLENEGYEVVLDGVSFVHGEQDAKYDDNMLIYEKALTYFINDIRNYVGDNNLPFVITEALTNSAKYSNKLREIQNRVAKEVENTSIISNYDLYTNVFEPWHFGANSNIELGNRIAAEIISHNDTRIIDSIDEEIINVPYGTIVDLPQYLNGTFDNGYSGLFKVEEYTTLYDPNILGEQEVYFTSKTGDGLIENSFLVNVTNCAYIDGKINEYDNCKINKLPNDFGEVKVIEGDDGIYISASINDTDIWTDGENWSKGDMGQKDNNDDFRVYITSSSAMERMTYCLSSANLLRVYDKGVSLNSDDYALISNNLLFKKQLKDYQFRVVTNGIVNDKDNESNGLVFELFISYLDLGVSSSDDLKLCFEYNNITFSEEKSSNSIYLTSNNNLYESCEEHDECYINIDDLL